VGLSAAATVARVSARATIAIAPSASASASTTGSEKRPDTATSAANSAASTRYRPGRARRAGNWSRRAVRAGASRAGANVVARKSSVVASALPVRS
jgi:hypothetical protein